MSDEDTWGGFAKRGKKGKRLGKTIEFTDSEEDLKPDESEIGYGEPKEALPVGKEKVLQLQIQPESTADGTVEYGLNTPESSVQDELLQNEHSQASEDLDSLRYVDDHKLLFLCCTFCARMTLISVGKHIQLDLLENKDSRDLCGMLLITCKADERAGRQQQLPFISEEILQGSRLHRIAEKVAKKNVEILAKDSMVMHKLISSFATRVTAQWMIRSVHTKLQPECARSELVLPFVHGNFM